MRSRNLLILSAVSLCCLGCSPGREVWNWSMHRVLSYEAKYDRSERQITRHEYQLARQAWRDHQESHADACHSADFGRGYRDGYAGYLHTGHPEPPGAPPERYRWFQREGCDGHQTAEEWFAGYRVGAMEAANSGCRQSLVVPASAPRQEYRPLPRFADSPQLSQKSLRGETASEQHAPAWPPGLDGQNKEVVNTGWQENPLRMPEPSAETAGFDSFVPGMSDSRNTPSSEFAR